MGRKREIILWTVVIGVSICVGVIVALDRRMATAGWPDVARKRLVRELQKAGLPVAIRQVRGSLIAPITMHDVTLFDAAVTDRRLLRAGTVTAELQLRSLFHGRPRVKAISVAHANLALPLTELPGAPPENLLIRDLRGRVTVAPDVVRCNFTGRLDGLSVRVNANCKRDRRARGRSRLTVDPWLPLTDPAAGRRARRVLEILQAVGTGSGSGLHINVDMPAAGNQPQLRLRLEGLKVLYQGMFLRQLNVEAGNRTGTAWCVAVEAAVDETEALRARVNVDVDSGVADGIAEGRLYPGRIAVLLDDPRAAPIREVVFNGPPPRFRAVLKPSPLRRPLEWRAEADVSAEAVTFKELDVRRVGVKARFGDGRIDLTDIDARVAPDADVHARGCWDLRDDNAWFTGTVDGVPHFVPIFFKKERARTQYKRIIDRFLWSGDNRPHGEVDVVRRPGTGGGAAVIVDARVNTGATAYNCVEAESGTARLLIDTANRLFILDHLVVRSGLRSAAGALVWNLAPDQRELRFRLDSEVAADNLLTLIHADWRGQLAKRGLVFPAPPVLRGAGRMALDGTHAFRLAGQFRAPLARFQDADARDLAMGISYDSATGVLVCNDVVARTVTWRGWQLRDVTAPTCTISQSGLQITGDVRQADGGGWRLDHVTGTAAYKDGAASFDGRASRVTKADWTMSELTGTVRHTDADGMTVAAKAAVATAAGWRFEDVSGEIRPAGTDLGFTAAAAVAALPGTCRVAQLHTSGTWRAGTFSGTGTAADLDNVAPRVAAPQVAFDFSCADGTLQAHFRAPTATVATRWRCRDVEGKVKRQADSIAGTCRMAELADGDTLTIRQGRVAFAREAAQGFYTLQFAAAAAAGRRWHIDDLTGAGRYGDDIAVFSLEAKNAAYDALAFNRPRTRMVLEGSHVSFNDVVAALHGGTVAGDCFFNLETRAGKLRLLTRDVGFGPLVEAVSEAKKGNIGGRLNTTVDLAFDASGERVKFDGRGVLRVRDGLLWSVPLLFDFMSMLDRVIPASDLAKVTELDCDLRFLPEELRVSHLRTNGSLVALTGNGVYRWQGGDLDFRLRAEPLRDLFVWRFLPLISDIVRQPLAVLLERRLTGTLAKPKWEDVTVLRDLFRDKRKNDSWKEEEETP